MSNSSFIVTPTNIDFLESVFRNPITNQWTMPIMYFNPNYLSPFYTTLNPLNDDPTYQKRVVEYFYMKLTEKWLYTEPIFRKLLKYFKIEEKNNKGSVILITNLDDVVVHNPENKKYKKYIFKYIEKYFINKHFISKILKQYIALSHVKWYDLFNNTDVLKNLFAHKIKKLIISTIYTLQDKTEKNKFNLE